MRGGRVWLSFGRRAGLGVRLEKLDISWLAFDPQTTDESVSRDSSGWENSVRGNGEDGVNGPR